jgi:glycosyltransferase involved in cell wall biosynthesis
MKYKILFLVLSDYESLKCKGVADMIFDRDEGGFFERVITVHPFTDKDRVIVLNKTHIIYEFGIKTKFFNKKLHVLKYLFYPLHMIRVVSALQEVVKKEKVHIIRATDPYFMGLIAWLLSRMSNTPFCISIHTDYLKILQLNSSGSFKASKLFAKFLVLFEKFIYKRAGLVMPISKYLSDRIYSRMADPGRIRVIPHGIAAALVEQGVKNDVYKIFDVERTKKIVSFVARLSKEKYPYDILEMAKKMRLERDDFIIIMVGGGPEEIQLRKMLESDIILNSVVKLAGFRSREIILDLRRIAMVNVCLLDGLSLIEASSSGRPVIAYDVEWHSELVINGITGLLVKEHDMDGLASAVCFMLDHPQEADRMGQNAKRVILDNYAMNRTSKIKQDCYMELISCKKGEVYHESVCS